MMTTIATPGTPPAGQRWRLTSLLDMKIEFLVLVLTLRETPCALDPGTHCLRSESTYIGYLVEVTTSYINVPDYPLSLVFTALIQ